MFSLVAILYSHQQCTRVSFSLHLYQYLFSLSFYNNHSNECEMVSHCGFDLCFPNNWCCKAYFHVLIGYLCIFFE